MNFCGNERKTAVFFRIISSPNRNRFSSNTFTYQLRSLYNICTILVQYMYNCERTNIVQVLYIYCTTTGVGMARMRMGDDKNFVPIVRFWGACTLYSYTNTNLHSYETRKKAFSNVFSGRNGHIVRMQRRRTDTAGTTTAAAAGQCGTGRHLVGVKCRERLYISGRYDAHRPAVDARLHRSDQR